MGRGRYAFYEGGSMNKEMIDSLLSYDPETGIFVWKNRERELFKSQRSFAQWNDKYSGKIAGTKKKDSGYIIISVFKNLVRAHHLAWIIQYGTKPTGEIDHINGNRDDNRILNLRDITKAENAKNKCLSKRNKTGFHGISLHKNGKYRVKAMALNTQKHLGYFKDINDAVLARKEFEAANGYHINHGRVA